MKRKYRKGNYMRDRRAKGVIITIITMTLVVLAFLFVDYFDIPSKTGFNLSKLNPDLWGIIGSNIIVVSLFIITFILFDKRNLDKDKTARYAGVALLYNSYRNCQITISLLKQLFIRDGIVEVFVDGEGNAVKFSKFFDNPFSTQEQVFDLLTEGYIQAKDYEEFAELSTKYSALILSIDRGCDIKISETTQKLFDEVKAEADAKVSELENRKNALTK